MKSETLVTTTYLEMFAKPEQGVVSLPAGCSVIHASHPTISFYRFLYNTVGDPWQWNDRKKMSDEELAKEVQNDQVEVHVLYENGVPAGYAELDRRQIPDIELKYFGIMPEFISKKYGRVLLQWAIDKAWSYSPKRFWVHTCSLDHPRALPLYQKSGFVIYKTEEHLQ